VLKEEKCSLPCCMCYHEEENIDHLFMDCKIIRDIKKYIHDATQRHLPISNNYRKDDLNIILQKKKQKENIHWRRLQLTTSSYGERCTRIFQKKIKHSSNL
jgi:hypothetical protein